MKYQHGYRSLFLSRHKKVDTHTDVSVYFYFTDLLDYESLG